MRGVRAKENGSQKDNSMILLLANTLMWSVLGAYMPFIHSFYSVRGLSTLEIGSLTAMTPLLAILVQPFWAYLSDLTGRRKAVLVSIVLASGIAIQGYRFCHVFFLAFLVQFGTSVMLPLMIGAQVLQSASYMIPYYCCIVFINENVVDGKISQGQSRLAMVQQGFATVTGSLLGGALSGQIGLQNTFMAVASGLILAGVVSMFVGERMFPGKGKG